MNNNWILNADSKAEFGKITFDFQNGNKVLKIGTGDIRRLSAFRIRKLINKAVKLLLSQKANLVATNFPEITSQSKEFICLSIMEANYSFSEYKTEASQGLISLDEAFFQGSGSAQIIAKAINFTKDLINAPPNHLTPQALAEQAVLMSEESILLDVEVLDKKACEQLGLSAFLAVAGASVNEPKLIEINYTPPELSEQKKIGLIGKGLTFDTGGLSLKPNKYMYGMKHDMAGAATVMGVLQAVAELKLPVPVTALVLACENSFGKNSYRPGDILPTFSGKTIEIVDTDAEGRVTLADAISYLSKRDDLRMIIDYATLTGSCASALGDAASGAFTNSSSLLSQFQKSADQVGEPIWELPLYEDYQEDLKSETADLLQCAGRPDASLAALFLKEFLLNDQEWLHLDIAGTAYTDEDNEYFSLGATGRGVWSTVQFLSSLS